MPLPNIGGRSSCDSPKLRREVSVLLITQVVYLLAVALHMALLTVAVVAQEALVGLFARVRAKVPIQLSTLGKTFATDNANVSARHRPCVIQLLLLVAAT